MMFVKHVRFQDHMISNSKEDTSTVTAGKSKQKKAKSKVDKTEAANLAEKIRRQKRDVLLRLLLEWPYKAKRLVQEKNEFGQTVADFITYAPMREWIKEALVLARQRVEAGEKDPDEKDDKSKAQAPPAAAQERKEKEDDQTPSGATADRKTLKKPTRGYC